MTPVTPHFCHLNKYPLAQHTWLYQFMWHTHVWTTVYMDAARISVRWVNFTHPPVKLVHACVPMHPYPYGTIELGQGYLLICVWLM